MFADTSAGAGSATGGVKSVRPCRIMPTYGITFQCTLNSIDVMF